MKVWIAGLLVMTLTPSLGFALSCIAPGPICSVFTKTNVIFRGKVLRVIRLKSVPHNLLNRDGTTGLGVGASRYKVRFQVIEMFRGAPATEVTLDMDSVSGFPFGEGAQYVVFASADQRTKQLSTSFCTRTHEFDPSHRDADVAWMRGRSRAPDGASIFGSIRSTRGMDTPPLATVSVRGALDRDVIPDKNGAYQVTGLPPGAYTVSAKLPFGFSTQPALTVSLKNKGCANVDWPVRYDSHINGWVLDSDGVPVANVAVTLVQQEGAPTSGYVPGIATLTTNTEGRYDFDDNPPGNYFVVANHNGPSPTVPYPTVFYPSASTLGEAAPIQLRPSATLDGVDLSLPKAMRSVLIDMTVKMQDGSAATFADVQAHDMAALYSGDLPSAPTDGNGRASLALYEGRTYYLTATAYIGAQQRCGGPLKFTAPAEMSHQTIVIEHNWGNCLAQPDPAFKAPE